MDTGGAPLDFDARYGFITAKQVALLLKILHVFKHLPADLSKKPADSCLERVQQEDELLFQIWSLLNPSLYESVNSRVVADFIKLLYDPYLKQEDVAFVDEKVRLALEFVQEVRKIDTYARNPGAKPSSASDHASPESEESQIRFILRSLYELTDGYIEYKFVKKGPAIPTERDLKAF